VKLPNGERAVVEDQKLLGYCLDPSHPRGRHKARVFASFGVRRDNAEVLKRALLFAAVNNDASRVSAIEFGERYRVDFTLPVAGRSVQIRSLWIVRADEGFPRLTSCYVL
jgi:hypothetical protein